MSVENLPGEEWRPVVGYEHSHEVSNLGRVRSLDRYVRAAKGLRFARGRILHGTNSYGYRMVVLSKRQRPVHRLVLEAFVGPAPEGHECRHLDGNPLNNTLGNLAWGTSAENKQDILAHGTNHFARRTECKHGHPYTPENTLYSPRRPTVRQCRACARQADARWRQRKKGSAAA